MKYQKAMAEVIHFNECEEFMAASGSIHDQLNEYISDNCINGYKESTDGGEHFTCKTFTGGTEIHIGGYTFIYTKGNNNSGKYTCSVFQ